MPGPAERARRNFCFPTCDVWLCLHLQPYLHQVNRSADPDGDEPRHHAGQRHIGQHRRMGGISVPELAEEPLRVAEDAKHHRAVDSNAGQREGHAFEEAGHLHGKGAGVTGVA